MPPGSVAMCGTSITATLPQGSVAVCGRISSANFPKHSGSVQQEFHCPLPKGSAAVKWSSLIVRHDIAVRRCERSHHDLGALWCGPCRSFPNANKRSNRESPKQPRTRTEWAQGRIQPWRNCMACTTHSAHLPHLPVLLFPTARHPGHCLLVTAPSAHHITSHDITSHHITSPHKTPHHNTS